MMGWATQDLVYRIELINSTTQKKFYFNSVHSSERAPIEVSITDKYNEGRIFYSKEEVDKMVEILKTYIAHYSNAAWFIKTITGSSIEGE